MPHRREWIVTATVPVITIILFLAICEFIVFRFIWLASDVPGNAFVNEIIRFEPRQTGVWRLRNEIAAPYSINAQGWNTGVGDYVPARATAERIAVVGDSFVESLQVPYDRSFAELLAHQRGGAEAYRFAISGAPMSQYLHMIEREVARYRPDWLIVLLVHNDFDESFRFKAGRYTSSFRKLKVEGDQVVAEIPPEPWRPGITEWLRRTATARFFLYRWQVRPEAIVNLLLPKARADAPYAANVEIDGVLAERQHIIAATDYLVERMSVRARDMGAKLILAMDGDRSAIYAGLPTSKALELNRIAADAAARHHVPFVDLHGAFAADWARNHRRFEFQSDAHWNEYGHAVVARSLAAAMQASP
jgi:GDSL-like Lipase/Acylhydrolase family